MLRLTVHAAPPARDAMGDIFAFAGCPLLLCETSTGDAGQRVPSSPHFRSIDRTKVT